MVEEEEKAVCNCGWEMIISSGVSFIKYKNKVLKHNSYFCKCNICGESYTNSFCEEKTKNSILKAKLKFDITGVSDEDDSTW